MDDQYDDTASQPSQRPTWKQITNDPAWSKFTPDQRNTVRENFYNIVVAPNFGPDEDHASLRKQFDQLTSPDMGSSESAGIMGSMLSGFARGGLRAVRGLALAGSTVQRLQNPLMPDAVQDEGFRTLDKIKAFEDKLPQAQTTGEKIAQGVGGLVPGFLTAGAGEAGASGQDAIGRGATLGQAEAAAAIDAGVNLATLRLGGFGAGGTVAKRVAAQAAIGAAGYEGGRRLRNAVLPTELAEEFDPVAAGLSVGAAAVPAVLGHGVALDGSVPVTGESNASGTATRTNAGDVLRHGDDLLGGSQPRATVAPDDAGAAPDVAASPPAAIVPQRAEPQPSALDSLPPLNPSDRAAAQQKIRAQFLTDFGRHHNLSDETLSMLDEQAKKVPDVTPDAFGVFPAEHLADSLSAGQAHASATGEPFHLAELELKGLTPKGAGRLVDAIDSALGDSAEDFEIVPFRDGDKLSLIVRGGDADAVRSALDTAKEVARKGTGRRVNTRYEAIEGDATPADAIRARADVPASLDERAEPINTRPDVLAEDVAARSEPAPIEHTEPAGVPDDFATPLRDPYQFGADRSAPARMTAATVSEAIDQTHAALGKPGPYRQVLDDHDPLITHARDLADRLPEGTQVSPEMVRALAGGEKLSDKRVQNIIDRAAIPDDLTPKTASRVGGALGGAIAKLSPKVDPNRELVRNDIRSALAHRDRAIGTFDKATRPYLKYYDRQLPSTDHSPLLAMRDAIAFEKGQEVPDPNTRPFFAHMRKMLDTQATQIRSYGKGFLEHLVTDYFPHQWKDPEAAAMFYGAAIQRRPLGGRKEFSRERVFDTLEDGIKAGLTPATHNPAEMVLQRYASGERLLSQLRIMADLEKRGLVKQVGIGERVPRGYAHVNDPAFGNRVVPELIARDLNNYLDPGLTKYAPWRGFRWLQNMMLSANLGFSAFHAGMTTIDTIATHADIGWRRVALLGDLKGGLRELANIPIAVVKSPYEGGKLVKQFYGQASSDPHTAAILHMLTEGGARGYMHPSDINDSFTKMLRAYDQGDKVGLIKNTLPGLIEGSSRLISHKLVPAQKMVARIMHAKFRLDEVAGALGKERGDYAGIVDAMNIDAMRAMSHEINSTIDDRLGQFAYDNLFWNKTFRDFLHASVQSVGWNFGTLRLLLGGAKDAKALVAPEHYTMPLDKAGKLTDFKKSRLSDRLSYLLTLNAVVGLSGAMLQYAMTGQGPQELKDFFFPRTGRKNRDGSDERLSFPSYVKDEFALATHPITTASHKVHPIFSKMIELANNRDFYGVQIFDPEASIPQEAKEILTYLGKSFMPYAVTGAMKANATGASAAMTALPFVGITPAPGDITRTPFLQYVLERYADQMPRTKTLSQAEQSVLTASRAQALREGKLDPQSLSPADAKRVKNVMRTSLTQYRFSRLPLPQQVHAYEMATPAERTEFGLGGYINHNLGAKLSRLPPAARSDVVQKIREFSAPGQ